MEYTLDGFWNFVKKREVIELRCINVFKKYIIDD